MNLSLEPFLYLSALLLSLGIYGLLTRREAHSAIASLQIVTHAIVIALVTLQRGSHREAAASAGVADAGFADAFGALIVMILGVQAVVGLSLVLHQQPARDVPGDVPERRAGPSNAPRVER